MAIGILAAAFGALIGTAALVIPRIVNRGNNPEDHSDSLAYLRQTGRTAEDVVRGNARVASRRQGGTESQQPRGSAGPPG
jgi:hypothetical protein